MCAFQIDSIFDTRTQCLFRMPYVTDGLSSVQSLDVRTDINLHSDTWIDLGPFYVHIRKEIKMNCEDKQGTLDKTCARTHTRNTHQRLHIVLYCVHVRGISHYW
jgi:hypothetical protein